MGDGLGRRFALLVEDEALIAMVAEDNLRAMDFDVIWVETGARALEALSRTPDLALAVIDVGLPDMRGDDLAARIRELSSTLPIIIVSGYDSAEIGKPFVGDVWVRVLGKPYSEHDLRVAINALGHSPR